MAGHYRARMQCTPHTTYSEVRALFLRGGREVLITRTYSDAAWGFPGVQLRAGESAVNGLLRICRELFDSNIVRLAGSQSCSYNLGFRTAKYRYFVCHPDLSDSRLMQHVESRWVLVPQLRDYCFDAPTQCFLDRHLLSVVGR